MPRRRRIGLFERFESRIVAAIDPFTIAVLPDTQFYSETYPAIFNAQTDWVVAQKQARNIVFATQLGDIVQNGERGSDRNLTEWQRADAAMDRLDGNLTTAPDGVLPYTALIGNHDYVTVSDKTSGNARYLEYFGPNRYATRSWYLEGSTNVGGHAVLFQGGGYPFLSLTLQYEALDSDLQWAQQIIEDYPGVPTILQTHSYLNPTSQQRQKTIQGNRAGTPNEGNAGESLFQKFIYHNPQIFLVMNGHFSGEYYQISTNIAGQSVIEMVMDYQNRANGGDGWLRLLEFDVELGRIQARTYSPTLNTFETDANSQFTLNLNFRERFGTPFTAGIREWQFQQGRIVGGSLYQGVVDTQLRQSSPNSSYGSSTTDLLVDDATPGQSNASQVLLRFDSLFGNQPNQIPPGAQILDARLVLESKNPGAGGRLHRMISPWSGTSTWNSLAGGVQANNVEARSAYESFVGTASLSETVPVANRLNVNVTSDLQAWANGEVNRGWAILPWAGGTDGWAFATSESTLRDARPNLTVRWLPPQGSNQSPSITFSGAPAVYTENAPPVLLFEGITLSDPDSPNLAGGSTSVSIPSGGDANDELRIVPTDQGASTVSLQGTNILVDGTLVGEWGGGLGRSPLTITWNAQATSHRVSTVLGRIGFIHRSDNPSLSIRKISLIAIDSLGAASRAVQVNLSIEGVDDPPAFSIGSTFLNVYAGSPARSLTLSNSIADVDSNTLSASTLALVWQTPQLEGDAIEIRTIGSQATDIRVEGDVIYYGTQPIADRVSGSQDALRIGWRSGVTLDAATALIRAISFQSSQQRQSPPERRIRWNLLDASDSVLATSTTEIRTSLVRETRFQQGVDNGFAVYSGTHDTQLSQSTPTTTASTGESVFIDFDSGTNNTVGLLRFDGIIGNGPGQIPAGSRVIDARLIVHTNNGGDGGGFYRVLIPWEATTATWNSLPPTLSAGKPVRNNGTTARISAEAQAGTASGNGDPDTGRTQIGVLDDVQAWANGEANRGWLIQGWDLQTDGWGFASSDTNDRSQRPILEVSWLPPTTSVVSFTQGVNGYAGTTDTQIRQSAATTSYESSTSPLFTDDPDPGQANESQVVLRFNDLFGNGDGKIPFGSQIHAATLGLVSRASNTPGDGGTVHRILNPLPTPMTWNSFGNGIEANDIEATRAATAVVGDFSIPVGVQGGKNQVFVTDDLQRWSYQDAVNHGWVFLPFDGGSDGWGIAPSEDPAASERPSLSVSFTAPNLAAEASSGTLRESGGSVTISIRMATPPRAEVRIPIRSSDLTEARVSVDEIIFTPTDWDLPKLIRVDSVEDWVRDGDQSAAIALGPSFSEDAYYHARTIHPINLNVIDDGDLNTPPRLTTSQSIVQGYEDETLSNQGTWFDPDANDPVTLSVNLGNINQRTDGTWLWNDSPNDDFPARDVIVTATDSRGFASQISFSYIVANRPPSLSVAQLHLEGSVLSFFNNTGSWNDVATDTVELTASIGAVTKEPNGTWHWNYRPSVRHEPLEVIITAADDDGGVTTVHFTLSAWVTVVRSNVYYPNSSFAAGGIAGAIDPSKVLATARETSRSLTFENLINTSRGINGLVFDIAGLASENLTVQDFVFRMSPTGLFDSDRNPPNGWDYAPNPKLISVQPGTSNTPAQVRVQWNDHAIENRWLQIQIQATDRTGLRETRTHYLGHLFGETAGLLFERSYAVQNVDLERIRRGTTKVAAVSNILDIDKDGTVQSSDAELIKPAIGRLFLSNISIPPAGSNRMGEGEGKRDRFALPQALPPQPLSTVKERDDDLGSIREQRSVDEAFADFDFLVRTRSRGLFRRR